jgi:hypothetical protein
VVDTSVQHGFTSTKFSRIGADYPGTS